MAHYRCFCLTADNRIITGAYIDAMNLVAVVAAARRQWQEAAGFHSVEVWLGPSRLYPSVATDRCSGIGTPLGLVYRKDFSDRLQRLRSLAQS
jgi:hypothetical protein